MDNDVRIATTRHSHITTRANIPSSSVEREAEFREEARERILLKLRKIDNRVVKVKQALDSLPSLHRQVIELAYMQMDLETDQEIAKQIGIPVKKFQIVKREGLDMLYSQLVTTPLHAVL